MWQRASLPTAMAHIHPANTILASCLVAEVVLTMMFLFIIMGSTHGKAPAGFAPIAIGLGLTLIHLISIPITNTSVNPARSTGPTLFVGGWALAQLWLFWVARIDRRDDRWLCLPLGQRRTVYAGHRN